MQPKIIERLLNENNESLIEVIQVVKENAVFKKIMSDIKEEFFVDDKTHGISHNLRVTLIACYIGIKQNLSEDEMKVLLYSALYHDIGRKVIPKGTRGIGRQHGFESAKILREHASEILHETEENIIKSIQGLCIAHSVSDAEIEQVLKENGIIVNERLKILINILKDADALDRVRLPHGRLDEKYLRTQQAKEMVDFSKKLYKEYTRIEKNEISDIDKKKKANDSSISERLLFDGENYYLLRSISRDNIQRIDNGNGIWPKEYKDGKFSLEDVVYHATTNSRNELKGKFISMTSDPNVVLTYDRSVRNKFILIRLSKEEVMEQGKFFSSGDYLLKQMNRKTQKLLEEIVDKELKETITEIFERIENATSIEEIKEIINGANSSVSTTLIDTEQQYLNVSERLLHAKQIARCKVLNYYEIMQNLEESLSGLGTIEAYTGIMRVAYHNSEWLNSGEIKSDRITYIPKILLDALSLVKQAEFQGKDLEQLRILEQGILKLVIEKKEISIDGYQEEYSKKETLREELTTIDKAFEMTGGKISYRDTNMQIVAIRSLAEMILNKRRIIEFLQREFNNIDVSLLLENTYCVNREMTTRVNQRGVQIGRNVNFEISDYGYSFSSNISNKLLQKVNSLTDEELSQIISDGISATKIQELLIKINDKSKKIQIAKSKTIGSKYIAEAIIEGYNWKKDGISLTKKEKEALVARLLQGIYTNDELHKIYNVIEELQIEDKKFTQNEIFAIIINIAIDKKIGNVPYSELLKKETNEIKQILLENIEQFQTSVLPISIDLLVGRGKAIKKLKEELNELGLEKNFLDSKHIKNVYMAKKIVEEYFRSYKKEDGTKISNEEIKVIIETLLKIKKLSKERTTYLITTIKNIRQSGIEENREIYGFIIKLAIEGKNEVGQYCELIDGMLTSSKNGKTSKLAKFIQEHSEEEVRKECKVTDGIIEIALMDNDILPERIRVKAEKLGISESVLNDINPYNIKTAIEIVEIYFDEYEKEDGTIISNEEKRVIIEKILKLSILGRKKYIYLTTTIENIRKSGIKENREIYGFIIKSAIEGNEIGSYANLIAGILTSSKKGELSKLAKFIQEHSEEDVRKECKVTDRIIEIALMDNDILPERIRVKAEKLGISESVLNDIDPYNMETAIEIVEIYFDGYEKEDGTEVSIEEKRVIIETILKLSSLDRKKCIYLTSAIENIRQSGIKENREIYGFIIKSAVEGNGIGTYNDLILGSLTVSQNGELSKLAKFIQEHSELEVRDKCDVTDRTLEKALIDYGKLPKSIKSKIEELGLAESIIKDNIKTAIEIVEVYFDEYEKEDGTKISHEEKRVIIEKILKLSVLSKERSCYLTTTIINIRQSGIKENREIYGFIIKSAIEGSGIGTYSELIGGKLTSGKKGEPSKLSKFIQEHSEEEVRKECKVTDGIIEIALMDNDILPERIRVKAEKLGISESVLNDINPYNIKTAIEIVEIYFDEYEKEDGTIISNEEKRVIIEKILRLDRLGKKRTIYLISVIENIRKSGIEGDREIYGFIIKSAIEGSGIGIYSELIKGQLTSSKKGEKSKIAKFIQEHSEEEVSDKCKVTYRTIEKALMDNGILPERIRVKAENLGLSETLLNGTNLHNIGTAIEIVEEYFDGYEKEDGTEVSIEEKRVIIEKILRLSSILRKEKSYYLTTTIENIRKSGIEGDREICGFIIKSAIEGNQIGKYDDLISGSLTSSKKGKKSKLEKFINEHSEEEVQKVCEVTDRTIETVVKKSKRTKNIKGQDIAKVTIELTDQGSGGSEVCMAVKADYDELLAEKKKEKHIGGDEQDAQN